MTDKPDNQKPKQPEVSNNQIANQEPVVCKLFVDQSSANPSVAFTSEPRVERDTLFSAPLFDIPRSMSTGVNQLPDPSTFFDNIGPNPSMNVAGANPSVPETFGTSLDIALEKVLLSVSKQINKRRSHYVFFGAIWTVEDAPRN